MRKISQAGLAAYDRGDYETALKEFRSLAEQGDTNAQYNLGVMYEQAKSVPQDYAEAVRWYRMAAEQGYALAQKNLSVMYWQGKGVTRDDVRAHMWANLADANGSDNAEKIRGIFAAQMTYADISNAQTMARECLESNYKNLENPVT